MSAAGTTHATTTPHRLATAIAISPPHLRVILRAVQDGSIAFAHAKPYMGRFDFTSKRPTLLLIGDDYDQSFGPAAFQRKSLKCFLRGAASAVVVAGAPEVAVYAAAVAGAVLSGRNSLIVESTERWEASWVALLRELAPGMPTLLSTPKRMGTLQ